MQERPSSSSERAAAYPVRVEAASALEERNRLTTAVRFFLAIPHILLVGAPIAAAASFAWSSEEGAGLGSSAGLLGAVAFVCAVIGWFAILLSGRYPEALRRLATFYLRWRVRAVAYMTLLRDEYPPFGDGPYPVGLFVAPPPEERDRLTVAVRILLVLPHLIVWGLLGLFWAFTTAVAWLMILLTGRYPEVLYGFALGMLAWSARLEAYMLLLTDEYPPFSLRA